MNPYIGKMNSHGVNDPSGIRPYWSLLSAALVLTLCAVLLSPTPAVAAEEDTHLFNATLSLTGDCAVSTIDPVPDPGCPDVQPSEKLVKPQGVTTDLYGNRYVLSFGSALDGSEGRVDVFSSAGVFLTEIGGIANPETVAVDSQGNMYVNKRTGGILRYEPTKYDPQTAEIEYDLPPAIVPGSTEEAGGASEGTLAVDPSNDHLFKVARPTLIEFKSAAEGNERYPHPVLESQLDSSEVKELNGLANSLAVDAVRKRLYVSDWNEEPFVSGVVKGKLVVKVFEAKSAVEEQLQKEEEEEEEAEIQKEKEEGTWTSRGLRLRHHYKLIFTIDGANTQAGKFTSLPNQVAVAADEETGHVFVGDLGASKKLVYEYDEDGNPVSTIPTDFAFSSTNTEEVQIALDDSPTSPTKGYLFVPSGTATGHSYAFEPYRAPEPPAVESILVSNITADDALLRGSVNPNNSETAYRFEYTSEEDFLAHEFEGAQVAGEGTLGGSFEGQPVGTSLSGLEAGTTYRVRLSAESVEGVDEAETSFTTYLPPSVGSACPNQALRTGPSALLPDCRAYELVTPADTNGHPPYGQETTAAELFPTLLASPDGNSISFQIGGGAIPGMDATGSYVGDAYLSTRGANGWQTEVAGPGPSFAPSIVPGSPAPDQSRFLWRADPLGAAAVEGKSTSYIRFPDGHSEVLGQGGLGIDPGAVGVLISAGGTHAIFVTGLRSDQPAIQIESDAAPSGTKAIYDRTSDGVAHVVSLLPGEVPLGAGENAEFAGASADGRGVAFAVGKSLYLRRDNTKTYPIGEDLEFAGVSEGGDRVFYLKGGDLFAFDAEAFDAGDEEAVRFTETGDATVVNISEDGSSAYFLSAQALPVEPNPSGKLPQPGEQNLYLSREGALNFVGTVTQRDVDGVQGNTRQVQGLGLWTTAQNDLPGGAIAVDPSRSTGDGAVLLFEAEASLTDYDTEGHTEIYRYDAAENSLRCLSCNPTGISGGDASLQSLTLDEAWLTYWNPVENLSADGKRAFFESSEALAMNDTDGLRDVYQWEEEGKGDCQKTGGCVRLISSGSSSRNDYLYAASASGDDVFFRSSDLLVGADPDETPSIYDARVNGGFAPPQGASGECLGEACQPVTTAPNDPTPASSAFRGQGNVKGKAKSRARCRKGKHRKAKSRCVTKKKHRKSKKHSGANGRAHR